MLERGFAVIAQISFEYACTHKAKLTDLSSGTALSALRGLQSKPQTTCRIVLPYLSIAAC